MEGFEIVAMFCLLMIVLVLVRGYLVLTKYQEYPFNLFLSDAMMITLSVLTLVAI